MIGRLNTSSSNVLFFWPFVLLSQWALSSTDWSLLWLYTSHRSCPVRLLVVRRRLDVWNSLPENSLYRHRLTITILIVPLIREVGTMRMRFGSNTFNLVLIIIIPPYHCTFLSWELDLIELRRRYRLLVLNSARWVVLKCRHCREGVIPLYRLQRVPPLLLRSRKHVLVSDS